MPGYITGGTSDVTRKPISGGVIFDKSGKKFVQMVNDKNIVDVLVIVGEESSLGQVEVVSGIKVGEKVILNPVVK
ncbi:MAG: hypothetical protein WCG45_05010 [bacterium]